MTIVIIRVALVLSGYPKLGSGGLHIAHVLYGGLMMLAALIIVFAVLNMSARWAAAFIGGVGFGFFIDEVGKFISNDVNYFFEPAVAVMYVVFMALFLLLYAIRRARMRPHDSLANALSLLREERDGTLQLRARFQVRRKPARLRRNLTPYAVVRTRLASWYHGVAQRNWFSTLVLVIMILYGIGALGTLLGPFTDGRGVDGQNESFAFWFQSASAAVTVVLIAIGLIRRPRSRVAAYRWFKGAILVSLFITQVFAFYHDQFSALIGVILDLLIYIGLSYMIAREEARERGEEAAPLARVELAPEAT